jgi:2-polyprenyl-6-methoxyphenol hydroxylase-like FAD-dependent oxidoreductase
MKVLVLGSGLAGLATAIALGERGHAVTLVEKDAAAPPEEPQDAFNQWERPGIPQFRQPHNFLGLGRRILRDCAPGVYEAAIKAGGTEVEQFRFITDGTTEPGDEDLATIACRRPVLDAILRSAAMREPTVELRQGLRAAGLVLSGGLRPHVEGLVLDSGERLLADLVVDASGRASQSAAWLQQQGIGPISERTSKCGLIYYSRHYRLKAGAAMPPYASVLAGPRGDLGYLAYAIFVGDNGTFCLCIMVPTWDRQLRALREPGPFQQIAKRLPGVDTWVDPEVAEPVGPILPMGQLSNTLRSFMAGDRPLAPGLQPIGDALCHTNPTFAFGASLSLHHAFTLADVLDQAADQVDLAQRFDALVRDDLEACYRAVAAEDRDRARLWAGEPIDVTDPNASMALFLRLVVYRVAAADSAILRGVVRRIDLLDPPGRLEQDEPLLQRARQIFREMRADGALSTTTPSREQLLEALTANEGTVEPASNRAAA